MKAITTGQEEQCIRFISDAARKAAKKSITELKKNGTLNADNLQQIIEKGDYVSTEIKNFTKELIAKLTNITSYLKLISGAQTLTLDGCEDSPIFGATEIFGNCEICKRFEKKGCNVQGLSTGPTDIHVYEMIKYSNFENVYRTISKNLDSLCLTQGQIKNFCTKYRNWIQTEGEGTFFLSKSGEEFFVCVLYFSDNKDKLIVGCGTLLGSVWGSGAHHRFVLPQQVDLNPLGIRLP